MKVYWGESVPKKAEFFLHPFLPTTPISLGSDLSTLPPPTPPLFFLKKQALPDFSDWKELIERAIHNPDLQKVVLARQTTLQLTSVPDPFSIAAALELKSKGAVVFCTSLPDGSFLLGATPERLFSKQGRQICVEALAGTKPLGKEKELLSSEKDLREFWFVREHFKIKLAPFLDSPLQFSTPLSHETATLHHLKSVGTATLRANVTEADLIQALHPSPALLGTPSESAHQFLQAHEPFARGFYGGLIGWSCGDCCDWRVVIRCCHIYGSIAQLYAGTGIVQGSNPEEEWAELETKQSLYKDIFHAASD